MKIEETKAALFTNGRRVEFTKEQWEELRVYFKDTARAPPLGIVNYPPIGTVTPFGADVGC